MRFLITFGIILLGEALCFGLRLLFIFFMQLTADKVDAEKCNSAPKASRVLLYCSVFHIGMFINILMYYLPVVLFLYVMHFYNALSWVLFFGLVGIFIYITIKTFLGLFEKITQFGYRSGIIIAQAFICIALASPVYAAGISGLQIQYPDAEWLIVFTYILILVLSFTPIVLGIKYFILYKNNKVSINSTKSKWNDIKCITD